MRYFLSSRRATFFAESIMKKFLVALLTVIALSGAVGAVLVAYPTSAAAPGNSDQPWRAFRAFEKIFLPV
jgi:hypothetical protein